MESSTVNPQAEQKKIQGNAEFKKGNHGAAINYYSEAIDIQPHEAILSNRAASFIAIKDFKNALDDIKQALRINPQFTRCYKRLFKANLGLGNIDDASEALKTAIEMDPNDTSNKADKNLMDEVLHQRNTIERCGAEDRGMQEDIDYTKAASYCNSILKNCPVAINYMCLRIKFLLLSNQLNEAESFVEEVIKRPELPYNSHLYSWRARVKIYCGRDVVGERLLREVLGQDPDNREAANSLKLVKVATKAKEEANSAFAAKEFEKAIELFDKCVELDSLNLTYNSTLLHNKAIAWVKLNNNDKALTALNQCLKCNPKYVKALVRRGDLKMAMKQFDEAVIDFAGAKEADPDFKDIDHKLKFAQKEQKQAAKKKDFYEVLGVPKTATEKELKTAYKKKALLYHPDRNAESEEATETASKKFKEVNEAYTVLSDPKKRQQFDSGATADDINSGHGGMGGGFDMGGMGGVDPNDIFKMFFSQAGGMGGMGGMPGQGRGRGGGGGQQRGGGGGFPFDMGGFGNFGGQPGTGSRHFNM